MRRLLTQTANIDQHFVQAVTADELHGIEQHAVTLAHAEDGDDVGVMQSRRRLGFAAEALMVGGEETWLQATP